MLRGKFLLVTCLFAVLSVTSFMLIAHINVAGGGRSVTGRLF